MYRLYIDESGNYSFNDPNTKYFVVCGLIVNRAHEQYIRHYGNFIKIKHFGSRKTSFHAVELFSAYHWKNNSKYKKLKRRPARDAFINDMCFLCKECSYEPIIVSVDVKSYQKFGKRESNVLEDAYITLLLTYIKRLMYLRGKKPREIARGQICIEQSSPDKALAIMRAYERILSGKYLNQGLSSKLARELLVSLKLVSKHNDDTEVQIADILGFVYAKRKAKRWASEEQKVMLNKLYKCAKDKRFTLHDLITKKRHSSFIDLDIR